MKHRILALLAAAITGAVIQYLRGRWIEHTLRDWLNDVATDNADLQERLKGARLVIHFYQARNCELRRRAMVLEEQAKPWREVAV